MVNMSHRVTLIPGDGIGPEVADATARAVDATGVNIDWERAELNAEIILKTGRSLPQHVIEPGANARRPERSGDHAHRRRVTPA